MSLDFCFVCLFSVFLIDLSLAAHPGPVCFGRPYKEYIAPDYVAHKIMWTNKALHKNKVAVHGLGNYI